MKGLLRTIGIDAECLYVWGGTEGPQGPPTLLYWNLAPGFQPSLRFELAQKDCAPSQPHYNYHAVTRCLADNDPVNCLILPTELLIV